MARAALGLFFVRKFPSVSEEAELTLEADQETDFTSVGTQAFEIHDTYRALWLTFPALCHLLSLQLLTCPAETVDQQPTQQPCACAAGVSCLESFFNFFFLMTD